MEQIRRHGEEKDKLADVRVAETLGQVRVRGGTVIKEYTLWFDDALPIGRGLNREEVAELSKNCGPEFVAALERATQNTRDLYQRQMQQSWLTTREDGALVGQRVHGLHRIGIYAPGDTAAYPSSALMNMIPAKIVQVGEITVTMLPQKDNRPNPNIMTAALIAGVGYILLIDGVQTAVALAYGTETVLRVDKIVGPGNAYVATTKRRLYDIVDIDMIVGPSETLVLADETVNPVYLAADLFSQMEHDVLVSATLLTSSLSLAQQVVEELECQTAQFGCREIMEQPFQNYGAVLVCDTIQKAVALVNSLAPKYLEVCYENPIEYLGCIDNAGSVFLGGYSPEPLGDYYAGANHALPTGGTAWLFSPLSVDNLLKKSSFIYYTKQALAATGPDVIALARAEGLAVHTNSIKVRM